MIQPRIDAVHAALTRIAALPNGTVVSVARDIASHALARTPVPEVEGRDELVERLRKMARCVYLATEASVADDIADGLTKAADAIEAQRAEIKALCDVISDHTHARALAGKG